VPLFEATNKSPTQNSPKRRELTLSPLGSTSPTKSVLDMFAIEQSPTVTTGSHSLIGDRPGFVL
jgi:hypothetical protein